MRGFRKIGIFAALAAALLVATPKVSSAQNQSEAEALNRKVIELHIFEEADVRVEYSAREEQRDPFLETVLSAIVELEEALARSKPKHR